MAAAAVAILTIILYYKERLQIIVNSHKARWELREIVQQKEEENDGVSGDDNQPRVSGIFIHPGECIEEYG